MDSDYHEKLWEVVSESCTTLFRCLAVGAVMSLAGVRLHGSVILFCVFLPITLSAIAFWFASQMANDMLFYVACYREKEEQQNSTPN